MHLDRPNAKRREEIAGQLISESANEISSCSICPSSSRLRRFLSITFGRPLVTTVHLDPPRCTRTLPRVLVPLPFPPLHPLPLSAFMADQYRQPLATAPHSDAPQYQPQYAQAPQGYGQPAYAQQQPAQYQPQPIYANQPQAYGQQISVPVYQPNVGPCAAGGGHSIKEEFTACGLVSPRVCCCYPAARKMAYSHLPRLPLLSSQVCGILLFPIGLICCLTMKDRTCMRCGMKFD